MFSRRWRNLVGKHKLAFGNISDLSRENVVMHVCTEGDPEKMFCRVGFGGSGRPIKRIKDCVTKSGQALSSYSSSDLDSPFEHLRFNCNDSGKILVFHNKRNIIRAGKHTHADALLSVLRFFQWSNCNEGDWFTGIATPNSVLSGRFRGKPTSALKESPYVSFSDKFPGISVNVAHAFTALARENKTPETCCTPEIYMSGKFIIPGVKLPEDLVSACMVLNNLGNDFDKEWVGEK